MKRDGCCESKALTFSPSQQPNGCANLTMVNICNVYAHQISLSTLNLPNVLCLLYLYKAGEKIKGMEKDTPR